MMTTKCEACGERHAMNKEGYCQSHYEKTGIAFYPTKYYGIWIEKHLDIIEGEEEITFYLVSSHGDGIDYASMPTEQDIEALREILVDQNYCR